MYLCVEEEPLLDDLDEAEDSWKYYQVARADYKPFHQRLDAEEKLLFVPSVRPGIYSSNISHTLLIFTLHTLLFQYNCCGTICRFSCMYGTAKTEVTLCVCYSC